MIKNRVREVRKQRGLTLEKLADMAGLSASQISRIERQDRGWSVESLPKIAEALGVTVAELIDTSQVWVDAPVVGNIGTAIWASLKFNGTKNLPTVRVPAAFGELLVLMVNGSAYYPRYLDGELIGITKNSRDPADCIDQECLVGIDGGQYALKTIYAGTAPGRFALGSHNEPMMHDRAVLSCRPVIYTTPASAARP